MLTAPYIIVFQILISIILILWKKQTFGPATPEIPAKYFVTVSRLSGIWNSALDMDYPVKRNLEFHYGHGLLSGLNQENV